MRAALRNPDPPLPLRSHAPAQAFVTMTGRGIQLSQDRADEYVTGLFKTHSLEPEDGSMAFEKFVAFVLLLADKARYERACCPLYESMVSLGVVQ